MTALFAFTEYLRVRSVIEKQELAIAMLLRDRSNADSPVVDDPAMAVDKPNPVVPVTDKADSPFSNIKKHLLVEQSDDLSNNNQYMAFFEKYCNAGTGPIPIWPKGEDSWQRRAPGFLVIGAKKAGTTSFWGKLIQHPFIVSGKTKEMHSFQWKAFGQWPSPSQIGTKLNVEEARRSLYDTHSSLYPEDVLKRHPRWMSFEATPDYLLLSDISSHIILCTVPWVKILVTLRDPLERLFSNYNFVLQHVPTLNLTFEEWVERDMNTLRAAGVIGGDNKTSPTSREEQIGWKYYQKMSKFRTPERQVGRSLYVLQLEAWIKWMREAGRDPQANLRVVWQEDLRANANGTLNDIAQWLGLPEYPFDTDSKLDMMVTSYSTKLAPTSRSRLEQFFAPYTSRLHTLQQREQITFPSR